MTDLFLSQAVVAFNPFSAIWEAIKQILGWIMNVIYLFYDNVFHVENIALCIITFTVVVYTILIPTTIKQQRSMKLNSFIQPEINAITKKYKNKKDQDSMMRKNEEMQAVYQKYGTSPTGGCLTYFIQLPIMFALYRVLYNIPNYVDSIKALYAKLCVEITSHPFAEQMTEIAKSKAVNFDFASTEDTGLITSKLTEVLYKFTDADWKNLTEKLPELSQGIVDTTKSAVENINSFIGGLDIAYSPSNYINMGNLKNGHWYMVVIALMIPVLAGLFSWLSMKVSGASSQTQNINPEENPMASSMKMMNTMMPLMSVFFCYTLPIGIGIYWIVSSLYRVISQYFIGKHLDKIDVNDIVKANLEKYNKKLEKQGLPPQKMKTIANTNVRNTEMDQKRKEQRDEDMKKSTEYYNQSSSSAKPGSLKAKANMVQQYNEKHKK